VLVQPRLRVLVGRNDGFFLDQARVGFDAAYRDDLRFRAIIDVNSFLPGGAANQTVQAVLGAARDVWVSYLPNDWLSITAGQQFMPSDIEGSTTLSALPFIGRSVLSSGVRAGQGYATAGLSPSRQLGLVVQGTEGANLGSLSLEYALGIGNGNGQNISGNDNKLPAGYLRLGAGYEDVARVAIGGRFNPRTAGSAPDLFDETDVLGFADVNINVVGIEFAAVGQVKQTNFATLVPDPESPFGAELGWGATAWVALREPMGVSLAGIVPAYRFSVYDPSSRFPDDQVLENTLAAMWAVPFEHVSLSVVAEVALLTEFGTATRDLDNLRAGALVQLDL
jgi:Phosphate-selective porin O and P